MTRLQRMQRGLTPGESRVFARAVVNFRRYAEPRAAVAALAPLRPEAKGERPLRAELYRETSW